MSFQKFKSNSYCVGGRHQSSTIPVVSNVTSIDSKRLIGYCPVCNRKKSMTVSGNTKQATGLCNFFKNLG